MNMYKPPHKHVGDKDKPGQTINPVLMQEKTLAKEIDNFKEKKLSDYDYLEIQRFFNSMNGR